MKKVVQLMMLLLVAIALVGCNKGDKTGAVESIKIKTTQLEVQMGKSIKLKYAVTPSDAKIEGVEWKSDDETIATVSQDGTVNAKKPGVVTIRVTVKGTKIATKTYVSVSKDAVVAAPDLGGYTIKIAQAEHALGEYDVNLKEETKDKYGFYTQPDKAFKQQALKMVKDKYNCDIQYVAYPSDAAWGPSRWSYIVTQAQQGKTDYDFYVVPDGQIPTFADANAIQPVGDWYDRYGEDLMSKVSKTAGTYQGKLYSLTVGKPSVYNVIGYNINLLTELQKQDATIEEPAKLYNEGKWSYTDFKNYAEKVQTAMNTKYGINSETNNPNYYAVAGNALYYWIGMSNAAGKPVLDVSRLKANLKEDAQIAAADTLKYLFEKKIMDPAKQVDQGVKTWNEGKALFNTGDAWFVNTGNRWANDLWGEGETKYGYVPFPAPDGYDPEKTYIGLVGEACQVMVASRDSYYDGFGDECTAENIYRAYADYYTTAKKAYEGSEEYDLKDEIETYAQSRYASSESVKAYTKISLGLNDYGFYDPYVTNSNPITGNTGYSGLSKNIWLYIQNKDISTWAEAVDKFQSTIDEKMVKIYG